MKKNPPRNFVKYASSPTFDGIKKHIASFYCSEKIVTPNDDDTFAITNSDGQSLSLIVLQTARGFYFGHFEEKDKS